MELEKKRCIGNESYVTSPLTLTFPTDAKYNGREIAIYNKGMTTNSTTITIVTGSGSASIAKGAIGVFKAVFSDGRIRWIRTV